MTRRLGRRAAYTLLELILALAIGMLLLWALYVVLSSQLASSHAGRESIQEATLARAILARMASDITGSLAAYDPNQVADAASSGGTTEDTGGATTGGTTAAAATDTTATTTSTTTSAIRFNYGVEGESGRLMLCMGRVPLELLAADKLRMDAASLPRVSDLRRIDYWLIEGQGLARREITGVTSTEVDSTPPDVENQEQYIIAPEVKSITLTFWDGTAFVESWSSSEPADAPIGPPAAIQIEIEFRPQGDQTEGTKYRQTVTLPTGNNYSTQPSQ